MEPEDQATPPAPQKERRKEPRHTVDGNAALTILNNGVRLRGRILDISMSGCQFRTDDCFPMGIYSRAEIEFQLEGLPFRLACVTQSIHKRNRVGVRFLEMSERKREQLTELVVEIEELLAKERASSNRSDSPDPD
jgi:c-di-GMP-binding flagellar brake protein YcgR